MLELSIYCITFKSNYRAVQVGVVKLYVANVKALRKKEDKVNSAIHKN